MPAAEASNLRDLLKVREDSGDPGNAHRRSAAVAKLTLAAVLSSERMHGGSAPISRTLLDIIRAEPAAAGGHGHHQSQSSCNHARTSWRSLKDRLRLRRAGAAWTSVPVSDAPMRPEDPPAAGGAAQISRSSESSRDHSVAEPETSRHVTGTRLAAALAAEREREELAAAATGEEGEVPVRMSLMALLEETNRQRGLVGTNSGANGEQVEEEDEEIGDDDYDDEEEDDGDIGRRQYSCCVCMVRHKGAAFIPCGHTFCRLCSRELWVSRGSCPICNSYILEILDLF